ncbi:MAG: hypothetical protein GDA46_07450, partial [Bdellovibrionales bacterium]|nr:hypothetical protein [Bdellovibrionales bacterium]
SEDERMQELAYDEYRRKMDYRLDIQDSKEEGFEQGRKEGQQEIVLNMLKEKVEIAFISKITGFSKEEIEKLKKNS